MNQEVVAYDVVAEAVRMLLVATTQFVDCLLSNPKDLVIVAELRNNLFECHESRLTHRGFQEFVDVPIFSHHSWQLSKKPRPPDVYEMAVSYPNDVKVAFPSKHQSEIVRQSKTGINVPRFLLVSCKPVTAVPGVIA